MQGLWWIQRMRRGLAIWLVMLLVACGGQGVTPIPTSPPTPSPAPRSATSGPASDNDKIDEVFQQLLAIYQSEGPDAAAQFARDQGLLTGQNEVRVTLILDTDTMDVVNGTTGDVTRLGGRVTATTGDEMEIVVPLQTLLNYAQMTNRQSFFADLARFQHVRDIRRTPTARLHQASSTLASTGSGTTNEGVKLTGADAWHAVGITGKSVKVGVIDGTFNRYMQVLGTAQVVTKSFRSDGEIEDQDTNDDTIHGTACAEIVHEMAPDATLYLVATDTPGSFASAVTYLVKTAGVSVITTSVGWNAFQLNGTSVVAKAVDSARAAGVVFTVAAGNEGDGKIGSNEDTGHFAGTFTDTDQDGYHDFPGARTKNGLSVKVGTDPIQIFLSWADWEHPHVNYDLYLVDRNGKEAARSTIDQARTGKPPLEVIRGKIPQGTYTVKIRKANADDPDLPFDIFFYGAQFEQVTPMGSLDSPADAAGAITVGAVEWKSVALESFSSQGPTVDGRKKPDIGGPDRVSSAAYATLKESTFSGTSAASPSVAGAAVLYRQAFPKASPTEILDYFTKNAKKPAGTHTGENLTGAGVLYLGPVPQAASAMPAPGTTAIATILPAPTAIPAPRTVFTDSFTMPTTGLPAGGYMNGAYRISAGAGQTQIAAYPMPLTASRVTYEVTAQRISGAADGTTGLIARRQDADNYLAFAVTNDGSFTVFANVNAQMRTVVPATKHSVIQTNAANTLQVIADGTLFTFSVNGQVVSVVDIRDVWRGGTYGIFGRGDPAAGADFSFTKFAVTGS